MANLYQVYEPAIQAPFQQGLYGSAWGAAFGEVKDQLMNSMKLGVLARFTSFAPLDALGDISVERGIYQGTGESTATFISALLNAWGAWSIGGTYWGLLAQLANAGYATAYIVAANGYLYGPSSGVTVPNPVAGIAGNPPGYSRLPGYYASGSAPVSNKWTGSTVTALNSIVTPTTQPGTYFIATRNGTTGASEPTWPGVGGSVTDGGVIWYYAGNYTGQLVYDPWNFGGGDGQGDPGNLAVAQGGLPLGGAPSPDGSFWSRFIVMFDPPPASWTNITNPPTGTTSPTIGEISIIQSIIAKWKPGKSSCVGIASVSSCWAWPLITTTNIPFSCWLSSSILTGDAPNGTAFVAARPQTVGSWLPNTAITDAGGSTYMFTVPSSGYQTINTGTQYLYSSPSASGTTGLVEPSWPTTIGSTVTDNGITWTCIATLDPFTGASAASIIFQA